MVLVYPIAGHLKMHLGRVDKHIKKRPPEFLLKVSQGWRLPTLPLGIAVPSALTGLTSLFGMGRGGSPSLLPPFIYLIFALAMVIYSQVTTLYMV